VFLAAYQEYPVQQPQVILDLRRENGYPAPRYVLIGCAPTRSAAESTDRLRRDGGVALATRLFYSYDADIREQIWRQVLTHVSLNPLHLMVH